MRPIALSIITLYILSISFGKGNHINRSNGMLMQNDERITQNDAMPIHFNTNHDDDHDDDHNEGHDDDHDEDHDEDHEEDHDDEHGHDDEDAHEHALVADHDQQITFWLLGMTSCILGVGSIVVLFRDSRKNKNYSNQIVRCFIPMMLGDLLFITIYLPYFLQNLIQVSQLNETMSYDPGENITCKISWFFATIAIFFQLFGLVLVSYAPFVTIKRAQNMVVSNAIVSLKQIGLFCFITTTFGVIWFAVDVEHVESYKHLYCGPNRWYEFSGKWFFSWILISCFIILFFTSSSYAILYKIESARQNTNSGKSHGSGKYQSNGSAKVHGSGKNHESGKNFRILKPSTRPNSKAGRNILKFGMYMIISFILCFGSFLITTFMNFTHEHPSMSVEMMSFILISLKTSVDVYILYHLDVLKKGRIKRGSQKSSAVGTKLSVQSTNVVGSC